MSGYVPPKKNAEFIFYVSLVSQASSPSFQTNPTLAAGDVKVSTDGGAFGNISTLPAVTPAGGVSVKVTVSAAEMNGDNVVIVFQDAAGAEWHDLMINLQPATRQIDDLAYWDEVLENTLTAEQMMRLMLSVLTGKSNGGGTASIKFRDNADTKNRITATVDGDGNRTIVALDGS